MASCFQLVNPKKIMCFFRDEKYMLKINLYNKTFNPEYNITLVKTTNKTEDENLFFKGIAFDNSSAIFAYYTSYDDKYLRFCTKTLNNEGEKIIDYGNYNNTQIIDATNFNKNFSLNDIIEIENKHIYIAVSSKDRENLYVFKFVINETYIEKKYLYIPLFKD